MTLAPWEPENAAVNPDSVSPVEHSTATVSTAEDTLGKSGYGNLRDLALPVLVSSCSNIVLAWLYLRSGCLGLVLTGPMVLLAVQEFLYFGHLPREGYEELKRRGRLIGLFELGIGVFNPVAFVCGVLLLLALRRRARSAQPASAT